MELRTIMVIYPKNQKPSQLEMGRGKYNQKEEAKDVVLIVHKSGAHKTNCVTIGYLFVEFS
jgi:hypothetical protein